MSKSERVEVEYRGHKIEVSRDLCQGGWSLLYYNVFTNGGHECVCHFEDTEDTVAFYVELMKRRIDSALDGEDDWEIHDGLTSQERAAILRWHGKRRGQAIVKQRYSRRTDPVLRGTRFAT